jgi:malate permease and related proteins
MSNLILLPISLIAGWLFHRLKILPDNAPQTLNGLIINLFLPAITLRHTVEMPVHAAYLLPVLSAWLVFGGACLFFWASHRWTQFDRSTLGALIVTAGISSISFVGFPIFEMLYGAEGLQVGIMMSLCGTFLVCSTAGIAVVEIYADATGLVNWKNILKNILKFPPFAAFCIAFGLRCAGYHHSTMVVDFLQKLGSPMNVIALFSIGFQSDFSLNNEHIKALRWGLFYKLIIAPLLVWTVYIVLLKQSGTTAHVSVLGSVLGSMNTIGIIAMRQGLNPPLIAQMLSISIPLSLLLLPLFYGLL